MKRTKLTIGTLLAIILLATQVLAVGAAPAHQEDTPITGNVDSIVIEINPNTLETTVLVTLTDETGNTQTVRLSLEDAITLGLLTEEGEINPDATGSPIEIDPALVIPDEVIPEEGKQHPVGSKLADFFFGIFGVDYETVMEQHDNGVGFGVIAQALWMTNALEGDSTTFAAIIEAKQNKDYSGITLPDGSTPQNWGQFRKAIMKDREKAKENLGAIMSGRAENQEDGTLLGQQGKAKKTKKTGHGAGNTDSSSIDNVENNANNGNNGNNGIGNNGNNKNDKSNNGKGNDKGKGQEKTKNK